MSILKKSRYFIFSTVVFGALCCLLVNGVWYGQAEAASGGIRKDLFLSQPHTPPKYLGSTTTYHRAAATGKFNCESPVSPFRCFTPGDIQVAYNIQKVLKAGFTGKGSTIVIIDAFQSPTIAQDLHNFDQLFGLNDPTLNILTPEGPVNPDPGAATEITLDVEWAHAIAPDATIDLVLATSLSNADIFAATKFAITKNLGDVISQSFGENESCDPNFVRAEDQLFAQAAQQHISVLASSGDTGAAALACNGSGFALGVGVPAADPLVTAAGGTTLYADEQNRYVGETSWNESGLSVPASNDDTGGGFSTVFARPSYQDHVPGIGQSRGIPDVGYDADVKSGVIVLCSSCGLGNNALFLAGGTSSSCPQWAGIVALGDQLAGKRLGFLNPAIYAIAQNKNLSATFQDVYLGNNTFAYQDQQGNSNAVIGYATQSAWDPVTGWGSPNVANFLAALVQVTKSTRS